MRSVLERRTCFQSSCIQAAFLVITCAPQLASQVDTASPPYTLQNLPSSATVRVHTHGPSIVFGHYLRASADSLFLARDLGETAAKALALHNITAVWFRNGSKAAQGFLLGAGVGLGCGIILGYTSGGAGDLTATDLAKVLGLFLGSVGALSGLVAGGLTANWEPVRLP